MGVDYFIKWIEAKFESKITDERVHRFFRKNIMCRFDLPGVIVSDNETQFFSITVIDFCKDMGVQTKFVSVVHP